MMVSSCSILLATGDSIIPQSWMAVMVNSCCSSWLGRRYQSTPDGPRAHKMQASLTLRRFLILFSLSNVILPRRPGETTGTSSIVVLDNHRCSLFWLFLCRDRRYLLSLLALLGCRLSSLLSLLFVGCCRHSLFLLGAVVIIASL